MTTVIHAFMHTFIASLVSRRLLSLPSSGLCCWLVIVAEPKKRCGCFFADSLGGLHLQSAASHEEARGEPTARARGGW